MKCLQELPLHCCACWPMTCFADLCYQVWQTYTDKMTGRDASQQYQARLQHDCVSLCSGPRLRRPHRQSHTVKVKGSCWNGLQHSTMQGSTAEFPCAGVLQSIGMHAYATDTHAHTQGRCGKTDQMLGNQRWVGHCPGSQLPGAPLQPASGRRCCIQYRSPACRLSS